MKGLWKFSVAVSENTSDDYPCILRGEFKDTIIKAKNIGFDAVEIHCENPSEFPIDIVTKICNEEGMEISAISSGMSYTLGNLSITSEDDEIRAKALNRFREYIDLASHLQCMVIMGLMRGQLSNPSEYQELSNVLRRHLDDILHYAAEKEVVIVLEAINRYDNNFFKTVQETTDFIRSIDNSYFRCHIDTYHMNIEEQDLVEAIYNTKNWLGYVHFSDNNRRIPGLGHINFYSIARALYNVNYSGYIAVESLPYPDDSTAAEMSIAYLKNLEKAISLQSRSSEGVPTASI